MENKFIDLYRHSLGHKGFDYDQIDDRVFLGSNMCCQIGFHRELLTKNVRADISLEETRVDEPNGVDYFLWLPTKDHTAPTPDQLLLGTQTIDFFVEKKIGVYIHCEHGHGRAPTLYLAFLISKGMRLAEAMEVVRAKRPSMYIHEAQMQSLREFQKSLSVDIRPST